MFRVNERAAQSGLYRCTTCGVMVPISAGEQLPGCPGRCPDAIWTFFNERSSTMPPEVREVIESFPALDLAGDPQPMPVGARLAGVHVEPDDAPDHNPSLATFRFDGHVYFGSAQELLRKTRLVRG